MCLDGAKQSLGSGTKIQTTLLTTDSWQEAAAALYNLEAKVVKAVLSDQDAASAGYPLDLSMLLKAAESATRDQPAVSADAHVCGASSVNAQFKGTVRRVPWNGRSNGLQDLRADASIRDRGDEAHVATGPRTWRVSLEARSVKLKTCSATVSAAYSYGPLRACTSTGAAEAKPWTFRTYPPVLARQNVTTHLPKGFAAYSLTATKDALEAAFQESLHVEVWTRDAFRKDSLLGLAEVSLGLAFSQPLRRSARLPSMVHGFRVFDQVCLLGSAEEQSPDIVGEIRVLFFVEDLGPSATPVASQSAPSSRKAQDVQIVGSNLHLAAAVANDQDLAALAAEGLEALRSSPAYAAAFSLEMWKQQEEERAKSRMQERTGQLREELEEEYRQRELLRMQTFRQRQAELRELEQRAKKKLQEIQQREISMTAELSNSAAQGAQAKRRSELAIQACEEALRRQKAETKQALDFEETKHAQLESRLAELELEASEARKRCSEVQAALANKQAVDVSATLSAENEIQRLQLQLCEEKLRCETLAASRDHFRRKVQELCQRILQQEMPDSQELKYLAAPAPRVAETGAERATEVAEANCPPQPEYLGQQKPSPKFSLEWLLQQKSELLSSGLYTEAPWHWLGSFPEARPHRLGIGS